MKNRNHRLEEASVLSRFIGLMSVLPVTLVIAFVFTLSGIYQEERRFREQEYAYLVENYVGGAGDSLSAVNVHVREILKRLMDAQSAARLDAIGTNEKKFEEQAYYQLLTDKCANVENLDILFLTDENGSTRIWTYDQNKVALQDKQGFWDYLDRREFEYFSLNENRWQIYWLGQEPYYLRVYRMNGFILGAFSSEKHYSREIRAYLDGAEYQWFLYDENGLVDSNFLQDGREVEKYRRSKAYYSRICVERPFPVMDAALCIIFPNNYWLAFRSYLIMGVIMLISVCLALSIAAVKYLRKQVISPVESLVEASGQIIAGNFNYVVSERGFGEFLVLERAFNRAFQTVVGLRIDQYEQRLRQQENELKHLRQQLKPHFYLNALSVVKGMACQGETEKIQQYIDALTIHIRYMFRNNEADARVADEVSHVVNYVNMQKACFPNKVTAFIQCEEACKEERIPGLLLHTLVENAFKHAMSADNFLMFHLNVAVVSREEFMVEYEDAGSGFSPENLEKYARYDSDGEEHLGLNNLRRTLEIRYERSDLMQISNVQPHGARIEIRIPFDSRGQTGQPPAASVGGEKFS